jgi:starch phosphorylase
MTTQRSYFLPPLPKGLEALAELALDLRWSWHHTADKMWEYIDPELWSQTTNPWLILQIVSPNRLEALASDATFRRLMNQLATEHRESLERTSWFQQAYPDSLLKVAFFCMEFGLSEVLPLYSGGLGILAGDYLKTARELGVPAVGVGLLYQQGYFRQVLGRQGDQIEYYPYNEPRQLPVIPVRKSDNQWLRLNIDLPGRQLWIRVWEAKIGRVKLYLLDTNDPVNYPADRGITSELYGGGAELRFQQEMVLGIGGWRALSALNQLPNICHLNEGHAALVVLERARSFMKSGIQSFEVAMAATRPGNIFTTHTPVESGFDRFSPDLIERYLGHYAAEIGLGADDLLGLGRQHRSDRNESFNMAYLAVRGSGAINAVSHLHQEVSRRIFQPLFPRWPLQQVPISFVTNGVHTPTWDSAAADKLWTEAAGKERWLGTLDTLVNDLKKVPGEILWKLRRERAQQLITYTRRRLTFQMTQMGVPEQEICQCNEILDPNILTLGFARRFTGYKRPNLLLHDPDRLTRILNNRECPVQLIIAGKAHPQDNEGKALIRSWAEFIRHPDVRQKAVFIADYDMALAGQLVQGVDVWINTPRRPWEACGTSGMKVLVNGGLNLSERDGWWAEAFQPDVGWAIGDGREHDADANWDAQEAEQLYTILEKEVIPAFYDQDKTGIPQAWVERMRSSMAKLTPQFSSNRMLREYVEKIYLPSLEKCQDRTGNESQNAFKVQLWQDNIQKHWPQMHFGKLVIDSGPGYHSFQVPVYLGNLNPDFVAVEAYAEPEDTERPEIYAMVKGDRSTGTTNCYIFFVRIYTHRPAKHYTPRVIPNFEGVAVPLEANQILWYEASSGGI